MPTPAVTPESIIALLHEHDILSCEEVITVDSDLFTLGLDSLAMMQLLLHIEQHFQITLPPAEIRRERFTTPTHLAAWLLPLSRAGE